MTRRQTIEAAVPVLTAVLVLGSLAAAARARGQARPMGAPQETASDLRDTVELYSTDRAALLRRYPVEFSPDRRARLREFYSGWQARLRRMDFDGLGHEGRIDYLLLDNRIGHELDLLRREEDLVTQMRPWVPFAQAIFALEASRRAMNPVEAAEAAATLAALAVQVDSSRARARENGEAAARAAASTRIAASRSATLVDDLRRALRDWHGFYAGYDPVFTWWTREPHAKVDQALERYAATLREAVVGSRQGEDEPIVGDPIGAAALRADLAYEMIPYTPEELVAIAEHEFAWCETELKQAARNMGFDDDWRRALEAVKRSYVAPGDQPGLIRDLAHEATAFVEERDLVTIPPLAKEVWRMAMLSPEAQKVSPFFLGGEVIRVSYPTDDMAHEDKLMSMRGNNPHFSRATVHHELIPGHHLQGFMTARYHSHRRAFSTPFWGKGWALYWEMRLWDLGFPRGPEDRIGMLFWRSHRAARIIFSLRFHLGTMTADEAIDLLVNRVGHERANAEAEVRRSFNGSYPPLYQAAYMLGALQFRALHAELVGAGRMTERQFHDAVLRGGSMPVVMVRARLTGERLGRDAPPRWRFAGDPGAR